MANSSHSHSDHDGHDHSKHDHSHGGSHDHDHSHVPTVTKDNERKILISFFIIFTFMIVEAVGGVISGSLALLADSGKSSALLHASLLPWHIGRPHTQAFHTT